jgi:hypothetical protein
MTHCAFLHGLRDTVIRDKARTRLYQEPTKDEHSGRGIGRKLEGITGIKNQGSRQQLHLGSRTTLNKIFRKMAQMEIAKQIVRLPLDCKK